MPRQTKDKPERNIPASGNEEAVPQIERVEPEVEIIKEAAPVAAKPELEDDGIARLKKQLDEERALRERAERERNEATSREFRARNDKEETEVRLFDGAIAQLKANNSELKQRWAAAMSAQDYAAAADFQEAIADNTSKMTNIEAGKQSLKERPKEQPRPLDPVEAFLQRTNIKGRSAEWLRAHPQCVTDDRLNRRMIRAAEDAGDEGIQVDSPEYFSYVEDRLGINKREAEGAYEVEEPLSQASAPTQRRSSPPAVPVSRDLSPSGQKTRIVRLTPAEAEIARLSEMTPLEYWNMKHRPETVN